MAAKENDKLVNLVIDALAILQVCVTRKPGKIDELISSSFLKSHIKATSG